MSKTILTSTLVSGSITSTGSFGDIRLVNPTGHSKILSNDSLVLGAKSVVSVNIDYDGNQTDRAFIVRNNTDLATGGTELFRVNEDGNSIFAGDVSGSITSTGSFGNLLVMGGGSTAAPRFEVKETGNQVISGSSATMTIRYGASATGTNQPGLNINGGNMMFVGNNKEVFRASDGGHFIVNENGVDVNTRIETNNDTHALFIDGGKDSVSIGSNAADNNNHEKLTVAGNTGITGSLHVSGNITTSGSIIAKEFRTEFINQVIATSSGSTEFGDDTSDVHRFTGSLNISASTGASQLVVGTGNVARYISVSEERALFGYDGTAAVVQGGAGGKGLKLGVNNATLGTNAKLFISSSGNEVGIHTDSPRNGFDVTSNTHFGNDLGHTHKFTGSIQITGSNALSTEGPITIDGDPYSIINLNGTAETFLEKDAGTTFFIANNVSNQDIKLRVSDGGSQVTAIHIDASETGRVKLPNDNQRLTIGAGDDLHLFHDGTDTGIENYVGDLYITNNTNDKDIIFRSDNGSGGVEAYLTIDGSTNTIFIAKDTKIDATKKLYFDGGSHTYIHESANDQLDFYVGAQHMLRMYEGGSDIVHTNDNVILGVGNDPDLELKHDGTDSFISNDAGDLYIESRTTDKDIIFRSGSTNFITIDGSSTTINVAQHMDFNDDVRARFGASGDLQIVHTGNINYIHSTVSDRDIYLRVNDGGTNLNSIIIDGSEIGRVKLPNDNQYLSIGASGDLYFYHDGSNSLIRNATGNLHIRVDADDSDLILESDDGSGGTTAYITLDGSATFTHLHQNTGIAEGKKLFLDGGSDTYITSDSSDLVQFFVGNQEMLRMSEGSDDFTFVLDNVYLAVGTGQDLTFHHDGTDSFIGNATGDLTIRNFTNDKDIIFQTDDGSGGVTPYITLDGSGTLIAMHKDTYFNDNLELYFGSHSDVRLYYEPTNDDFYIRNANGDTKIRNEATDADIIFSNDDGSGGNMNYMVIDGGATSIDLLQDTRLAATKKLYFDGGGNTYIYEASSDVLDIVVGGQQMLQFVEDSTDYIRTPDNVLLGVGGSIDFYMNHNGTNSFLQNNTGQLIIKNTDTNEDIFIQGDDGGNIITAIQIDVSESGSILLPNDLQYLKLGTGGDGNLYVYNDDFYVSNFTAGKDTVMQYLKSDSSAYVSAIKIDASAERVVFGAVDVSIPVAQKLYFGGGDHTYISEDADDRLRFFTGGAEFMRFTEASDNSLNIYEDVYVSDDKKIHFGAGNDIKIYHNGGGNSNFENHSGDLYFTQYTDDGDIYFRTDDGSGGVTEYLRLDGGAAIVYVFKELHLSSHLDMGDDDRIKLGDSDDLQIVHTSNINFIHSVSSNTDLYFRVNDGGTDRDAIIIDSSENAQTIIRKLVVDTETSNQIVLETKTNESNIADTFSGNTEQSYIFFNDNTDSNDPGFIMHETRDEAETNEGVIHLCPSDDNADSDYISIHGTNDADSLKLATSGRITGVSELIVDGGSVSVPSIAFDGDNNTGIYSSGADSFNITTGGTERTQLNSLGLKVVNGALGVDATPNGTDGRIDASNDVVAFSSDKRLKQNIRFIENPLEKVSQLSGFIYNWNEKANKEAGYDMDKDYVGVFAQDVEKIQPEAVKIAPFDNDGTDNSKSGENYLTVQYEKLVPLLIESIKELKKEIEELKK